MNKSQKLLQAVGERKFDARVIIPRVLTSKEMKLFAKMLDNRLDPKRVKVSSDKILVEDEAFVIVVDNKEKAVEISGDITVQKDVRAALRDINIEV